LYALQHHIGRLQEDHEKARRLAEGLKKASWVKSVMPVETNIVIFEVAGEKPASFWVEKLKQNGVLTAATSASMIRMVTHLGVTEKEIETITAAIFSL
jgi:threonine aldolase